MGGEDQSTFVCVFRFFCNFVFCNCVLMGMGLGGRGRG